MCICSMETSACMQRPAVVDLLCSSPDCCSVNTLKLGDITDAVMADPTTGTPKEQQLIKRYEAAIEIAHNKLAKSVCLANYVAGCRLQATVCVDEALCECPTSCKTVCVRRVVLLRELDGRVDPERIETISIVNAAGVTSAVALNESGTWMLTTHDGWKLSGPEIEAGGTFTLTVVTKSARIEWLEAVKSVACSLVPGTHSSKCDRDEDDTPAGFINDPIAASLDFGCRSSGYNFGNIGSAVVAVKWVTV